MTRMKWSEIGVTGLETNSHHKKDFYFFVLIMLLAVIPDRALLEVMHSLFRDGTTKIDQGIKKRKHSSGTAGCILKVCVCVCVCVCGGGGLISDRLISTQHTLCILCAYGVHSVLMMCPTCQTSLISSNKSSSVVYTFSEHFIRY